jgi:hypothetical protein
MSDDLDIELLRHELEEAHKTVRTLLRQLGKEQTRHHEIARAYNMTVANLAEVSREHALLARDRDQWRARAEGRPLVVLDPRSPFPPLSNDEVRAIRKAIARLHHPDLGGDAERMKLWNAILDPLEI